MSSKKKKKKDEGRMRCVLGLRSAAMAASSVAHAAAREAEFVVNMLAHEPAVEDLAVTVKALRAIANSPLNGSESSAMQGLARQALEAIRVEWKPKELRRG